MKNLFITLISLWGLTVQGADFIRQTQIQSGVTQDVYLSSDPEDNSSGNAQIPLPIAEGGTLLELYAQGTPPDTDLYMLDSQILGVYLPQAKITITSEDSHVPLRTRADKPVTVKIQVSGLLGNPDAPDAAKKVLFNRLVEAYDPETHAAPPGSQPTEIESYYITSNGVTTSEHYTAIPAEQPTKAEGKETYIVYTLADETLPANEELDKETVLVWPLSEATVTGIEEGETYKDALPAINVSLKSLYPKSTTYLQIYEGEETLGTVGIVLAGSTVEHDTEVPQDGDISIENWEDYVTEDGVYTVEVLTVTPFNDTNGDGEGEPERIAYVTFTVDRSLKIRGQMSGSE